MAHNDFFEKIYSCIRRKYAMIMWTNKHEIILETFNLRFCRLCLLHTKMKIKQHATRIWLVLSATPSVSHSMFIFEFALIWLKIHDPWWQEQIKNQLNLYYFCKKSWYIGPLKSNYLRIRGPKSSNFERSNNFISPDWCFTQNMKFLA